MKDRHIAEFWSTGPAGAGPGAKLCRCVIIFAGFVFAETKESEGRTAVRGTSEKVLEGGSCLGKTILVVEQGAKIPPTVRPRRTQSSSLAIQTYRIWNVILDSGSLGLAGSRLKVGRSCSSRGCHREDDEES